MDTPEYTDEQALLKSRPLTFWQQFTSRRDYALGILFLLIVVFLWTSSSFITQDLFDEGYEKPFLLTYLSTATFTAYLLPYAIRKAFAYAQWNPWGLMRSETQGYVPLARDALASRVSLADDTPVAHREDAEAPLTVRETANLAGWFCGIWFVANWTLTVGLQYTSVASATILSSMSSFFTLALGRIFRVESLTLVKILAVVMSFGGVVLVSLADSSGGKEASPAPDQPGLVKRDSFGPPPIVGDSLALLSALFYAFYVTLLKVRIRSESRIDMQLFFGFVGLFNVIFLWPIGVILHFAQIERFELPASPRIIVGVLVSMAITLSSDYLYVIAMLKTTPLVVTIGLSLTMPLAVIGDFILRKPVKIQVIFGAIVVLLSFVAIGLEDSRNSEDTDLIAGKPLDEDGSAAVEENLVLESHQPIDSS